MATKATKSGGKKTAGRKRAPAKKPARRTGAVTAELAPLSGPPPYICVHTEDPNICLMFFRDPSSGTYTIPPGGQPVACDQCEYFHRPRR